MAQYGPENEKIGLTTFTAMSCLATGATHPPDSSATPCKAQSHNHRPRHVMCLAAGSARPPIHPPKQEPTGGEEQQAAEAPQAEAPQQPGPSGRRSASPHPSGRRSISPHPSAGGMWPALLALMPHTCVTWKSNFHAPKVTFYVGPIPSRVPQNSFELLAEKASVVSYPGHFSCNASSQGSKQGAVRGLQPVAQVAEHSSLSRDSQKTVMRG